MGGQEGGFGGEGSFWVWGPKFTGQNYVRNKNLTPPDRKLDILIYIWTWDSGIRQFGERRMVKTLALVLKFLWLYHNWLAVPERPVSNVHATFVLPEYLKMVLNKNIMSNVARFRLKDMGWSKKLVYTAEAGQECTCLQFKWKRGYIWWDIPT